jgi:2-amino-4-hydroxy-6-hydroxymethyldihydropteridine diphosphokinase
MHSKQIYLGLGSNMGNSIAILTEALQEIEAFPHLHDFRHSRFYQTSPVSPVVQRDFINAACVFMSPLAPYELLSQLQSIEKRLGKVPKEKIAPRPIDIDILLYGEEWIDSPDLSIPHPGLKERLFVLMPLSDLTDFLLIPKQDGDPQRLLLKDYLSNFQNSNNEKVALLRS